MMVVKSIKVIDWDAKYLNFELIILFFNFFAIFVLFSMAFFS